MKLFNVFMSVFGILVVCWRDPFIGVGVALFVVGYLMSDI